MNETAGASILLVEDNAQDAELTLRALRALRAGGFRAPLHRVRDGVEALEFIRGTGAYAERDARRLPKLVLLDLKMPQADGFDVLRELKADQRTRAIPILVLTSSNQRCDLEESYRLGVNGFVSKPVRYAEFVAAMARIGKFWLELNLVAYDV